MEGKRMPFEKLEIDLQKKTNLCLDQAFFLGGGGGPGLTIHQHWKQENNLRRKIDKHLLLIFFLSF